MAVDASQAATAVDASALEDERVAAVARRFRWPVIAAALFVVPMLAIDASSPHGRVRLVGDVLNWVTWLVFAAEWIAMLRVVPDRGAWLRAHLLDSAIVILTPPFLPAALQVLRAAWLFRLLRLLRVLRLVRTVSIARVLVSVEGIRLAAMLALATCIGGGDAFAEVEHAQHLRRGTASGGPSRR